MEYLNNSETSRIIFNLESRLAASLKPIRPDPVFLNTLKSKLSQGTSTFVETRSNHNGLILVGVGLAAGAIILWTLNKLKKL